MVHSPPLPVHDAQAIQSYAEQLKEADDLEIVAFRVAISLQEQALGLQPPPEKMVGVGWGCLNTL